MKKILIIFGIIFVLFVTGCSSNSTITPKEAKEMMDENSEIILLDVRTYSEYVENRIPGALLLPVDEIEEEAESEIPDKKAIYIVYCRSGNRSSQATEILKDLGYKNVYDMGGIIYWPYQTTSGH